VRKKSLTNLTLLKKIPIVKIQTLLCLPVVSHLKLPKKNKVVAGLDKWFKAAVGVRILDSKRAFGRREDVNAWIAPPNLQILN
jgi:hypothetical protein